MIGAVGAAASASPILTPIDLAIKQGTSAGFSVLHIDTTLPYAPGYVTEFLGLDPSVTQQLAGLSQGLTYFYDAATRLFSKPSVLSEYIRLSTVTEFPPFFDFVMMVGAGTDGGMIMDSGAGNAGNLTINGNGEIAASGIGQIGEFVELTFNGSPIENSRPIGRSIINPNRGIFYARNCQRINAHNIVAVWSEDNGNRGMGTGIGSTLIIPTQTPEGRDLIIQQLADRHGGINLN